MSPPKTNGTNLSQPRTNGFVGSSSSSTGTVPRMNGGIGSGGGRMPSDPPRTNTNNPRSLRQQSQQLERLLMEQQAKLQNSNDSRQDNSKYLTESLQDLKEKFELLQTLNASDNEQYDFQPRSSRGYDHQEFLNNLHRYQHRNFNPMDQLRSENSKLKLSLQQQQEHIHQLTQSLNHCFQAVLTIQRDVSGLQRTVASASTTTGQAEGANHVAIEDNLDSVSQQRDFESHSWDHFDFQPQTTSSRPSATTVTAPALDDPWNNFFSNQGGIIGGSESGVSTTGTGNSGALNNTVLPGIRANNYWDNFRSFSRQNRLSSAVAANNIPGLTPVVAQVTPRQVPQLHLPHSPFRANLSVAANTGMYLLIFLFLDVCNSRRRPCEKKQV